MKSNSRRQAVGPSSLKPGAKAVRQKQNPVKLEARQGCKDKQSASNTAVLYYPVKKPNGKGYRLENI